MTSIENVAKVVIEMDKHLRDELLVNEDGIQQEKKLWERTHIKHQIDRRKKGDSFTIEDHIRAMIYSMLSSGTKWERVEKHIDLDTGRIAFIDNLFKQYNPNFILDTEPSYFINRILSYEEKKENNNQYNGIKGETIGCGTQRTIYQMKALKPNIVKFQKWINESGSIDSYYQNIIETFSMNKLVYRLSDSKSKDKLKELGVPLVAEYLKNVGYSIAKPDRHICRILGKTTLGCIDKDKDLEYDVIDYISAIAKELGKSEAEVDYILWMYCADGYGEICTKSNPKCDECKAKGICKAYQKEHK